MKRLILGVGIALVGLSLVVGLASAEIPHLINFQGRLIDATGAPVPDGTPIKFSIYNVSGAALWSETHPSDSDSNGIFNVLLGSVDPINNPLDLPFDEDYWLGIKVGTDSEMTPRQRITSVGYAFNADKVKGSEVTDNILPSSGAVGIGTTSPSEKLEVNGTVKATSFEGGGVAKVYRSEWFPVTTNSTYVKAHGLETYPDIVQVFLAQNSDGSGWCYVNFLTGPNTLTYPYCASVGTWMNSYTSTQITIHTGRDGVAGRPRDWVNEPRGDQLYHSGYCRIVAIKY